MTEIIQIAVVIIVLITVFTNHWQNKSIDKQQAQINLLRETITEYMFSMNKFVQAQNDANEAIINTLACDEQKDKHIQGAILALAKHVEYLNITIQEMKGE